MIFLNMEAFLEKKLVHYTKEKIKTKRQIIDLKDYESFLDQVLSRVELFMDNAPVGELNINDELRKFQKQVREIAEKRDLQQT
jgi:hypothetical protein